MAEPPVRVLLMCTEFSARRTGGPGLTMELLLNQHEQNADKRFSLVAVFRDRTFETYHALSAVPNAGGFSATRQGTLAYYVRALSSGVRFLCKAWLAARGWYAGRVVHCHDYLSAYLARILFGHRVPIVLTYHVKGGAIRELVLENPALRNSIWYQIQMRIEDLATRWADVVVFTSHGSRDLFALEHPGLLDCCDVRVIHTGVDVDELDSVSDDPIIRDRFGVMRDSDLLLTVAALVPDKGLDVLVEAVAALPSAVRAHTSVLIIGQHGSMRAQLQRLILDLGLDQTVRLLGFVERRDLIQLMRQATLFVLPSRVAVFDYVLLEAGALGVPILTTSVGGNLEMFDRQTALYVPPDDSSELATVLARALADAELRAHLGANARSHVRGRFALELLLRSYEELYNQVSSQRRS